MRPSRALLLLSLFVALPAFPATRLTYSINGVAVPVAWQSSTINYAIDRRVADAMPSGAGQIERAVNEWSSVADAQLVLNDTGVVDGAKPGKDGKNTISLADELFANQRFIALTTTWYDDAARIVEADIQVDAMAIKGGFNLQQLIQHETGHLLGLDHSAVLSSVMYPYVGTGGVSSLDSDDRVAIATMYPRFTPHTGATLQGRVSGDDGGIFAAQVVALSDAGEPVSTGLTDRDGSFTLQGVPSGNYRIYAEPLDGPVSVSNLSGSWRMAKVKSFPTQFADGGVPMVVENGKIYGNINVNGAGAVQLNPRWVGASSVGATSIPLGAMPIVLRPGQTVTIAIGGDGFISGVTTFEIPSPGFHRVTDFTWSANYVSATFSIGPATAPGSVVVLAQSGNESAALTGALRIEPKSRVRAVIARK
ncbi:MAG: matrixin family metalloprotease [Acidobacteriota bacterium]